jgi:hypothetical protein
MSIHMKYLRRAVKYFIQMTFVVVIIMAALMLLGVVSPDINVAFRSGWKSVWMILGVLACISAIYPNFDYSARDLAVPGEFSDLRGKIIEYMESKGYVLSDEDGENLSFRLSSPFGKMTRIWEDTISFTRELGGFSVEGITRDIVRIVSGLQYKLRGNED